MHDLTRMAEKKNAMCNEGGKPQNLRVTWTARRLENLNSTRSPRRSGERRRFALDIPPSPPPPVERACSRPDGRPQSGPWSLDPPPRRGAAAAWIIAKCGEERDRGGEPRRGIVGRGEEVALFLANGPGAYRGAGAPFPLSLLGKISSSFAIFGQFL
jgi:hypothetical protein